MRVLFIHGRAQGGKSSAELLPVWRAALDRGLAKIGASLPPDTKYDLPFYGDTLDDFVARAKLPSSGQIVAMGPGQDQGYELFMQSVLQEIEAAGEITEVEIRQEMPDAELQEMGPQNWEWVQAIVKVIDQKWPGISGATIEKFLTDVYLYIDKPVVRKAIDEIVQAALTDEPTLVVGHSLGSVVGYNLLVAKAPEIRLAGYVTIGSPLGIKAITASLGLPRNPAPKRWMNAFDTRDIVALNPLDARHFPVAPPIANFGGVKNHTDNRHGITGYLDDRTVAKQVMAFAKSAT